MGTPTNPSLSTESDLPTIARDLRAKQAGSPPRGWSGHSVLSEFYPFLIVISSQKGSSFFLCLTPSGDSIIDGWLAFEGIIAKLCGHGLELGIARGVFLLGLILAFTRRLQPIRFLYFAPHSLYDDHDPSPASIYDAWTPDGPGTLHAAVDSFMDSRAWNPR